MFSITLARKVDNGKDYCSIEGETDSFKENSNYFRKVKNVLFEWFVVIVHSAISISMTAVAQWNVWKTIFAGIRIYIIQTW